MGGKLRLLVVGSVSVPILQMTQAHTLARHAQVRLMPISILIVGTSQRKRSQFHSSRSRMRRCGGLWTDRVRSSMHTYNPRGLHSRPCRTTGKLNFAITKSVNALIILKRCKHIIFFLQLACCKIKLVDVPEMEYFASAGQGKIGL